MKISQKMTCDVRYLHIDATIEQAFQMMLDLNCRHIPVIYEGNVVGMLSDRDILLQAENIDGLLSLPQLQITELMSKNVEVCREDEHVCDVALRMVNRRLDSFPVLDHSGQLVGIITSTDLLKLLSEIKDTQDKRLSSISFALEHLMVC